MFMIYRERASVDFPMFDFIFIKTAMRDTSKIKLRYKKAPN